MDKILTEAFDKLKVIEESTGTETWTILNNALLDAFELVDAMQQNPSFNQVVALEGILEKLYGLGEDFTVSITSTMTDDEQDDYYNEE